MGLDEFGGPLPGPTIMFSHSHDGFCLYFARLVRPVWYEPITKVTTEKRPGSNEDIMVRIETLN